MSSSILNTFADHYRRSAVGRTGVGDRDFTLDYQALLKAAKAQDGAALVQAKADLQRAVHQSGGCLSFDTHPRDPHLIHRVRLRRSDGESWLFSHLGQSSPSEERESLAQRFESALESPVPAAHRAGWKTWCHQLANAARSGGSVVPFSRDDPSTTEEILTLLPRLLEWKGDSMIRFASCVLCGDSKRLAALQSRLETALKDITSGALSSFDDLGLVETPRRVLLHGPVQLTLPRGTIDLGVLSGSVTLSEWDIASALEVTTTAQRCLTVENETTFHELTKRNTDTLLIQTSYPGRATLDLLRRLPPNLPFFHFGDTDPAGFDILRDLRERTGRPIEAIHMVCRDDSASPPLTAKDLTLIQRLLANPSMKAESDALNAMLEVQRKGRFEQEAVGIPNLEGWPFYDSQK